MIGSDARDAIRALLAELARVESLYAAATSTADSLEAINEAQVERARRHNAEVQVVVDGARLRHEEDEKRIKAFEAGLREAAEYIRCLLDEGDDSSPVAVRMAALRDLAGEP